MHYHYIVPFKKTMAKNQPKNMKFCFRVTKLLKVQKQKYIAMYMEKEVFILFNGR